MNQALSLTITHLNDTHSYFEPSMLQFAGTEAYVSVGGFARIATRRKQLAKQAAEQGRDFLLLHAGDCFQGTLYFSVFKGEANARLLNALAIDAMTVGNHELDLGNDYVADFADLIDFPLLSGNWDLSQEATDKANRLSDKAHVYAYDAQGHHATWWVRQFEQESVAIFGLSLDSMAEMSSPDPDTPFIHSSQIAQRTVDAIRATGINKIILLSHLSYEADKQLAEAVSGISVIIGGHSHILQGDFTDLGLAPADPYGFKVKDTWIVQSGLHAMALGHCEIDFAADGRVTRFTGHNELLVGSVFFADVVGQTLAPLDETVSLTQRLTQHPLVHFCEQDPEITAIMAQRYQPVVQAQQATAIITLPRALRHVRVPDEIGGSELGPLVAHAFYYALNKRQYSVDFAIHNAGGVRSSLAAGQVTLAHISGQLLPFAIPIGVYWITGETLAQVLEGAINNALHPLGTGTGSYPYCDRLRFDYQADQALGQRIQHLEIYQTSGWSPVLPAEIYCGTSSVFTMKGKEGYDAILKSERPAQVTHCAMAETMIELLTDIAAGKHEHPLVPIK